MRGSLLVAALAALLPLPGCAQQEGGAPAGASGIDPGDLPVHVAADEADPASVAMDPAVLARLDSTILESLADSVAPGAALAVGRHGRLVRLRGYGTTDWDRATPVTPETLYDLASLTKVVGTTTAVMLLVQEGRLDLDTPVVRHLPWWSAGDPRKDEVTVRQLLLHRAGLPPFRRWFFELEGEAAYREAIAAEPLETEPGAGTVYSDIGVMTLAFVVEAVSGEDFADFLDRRVWEPLGMEDTGFLPDPSLLPRIAPTEVDTVWRHTHVHGVVHDENADAIGGVAGHAGLFSTARDLAVFAAFMEAGGRLPPCGVEEDEGARGDGGPASGGNGLANGSGVGPDAAGRGASRDAAWDDASPQEAAPDVCAAPRPDAVRVVEPTTVDRFTARHDATASRALGWDTPSGRSSAGDHFTARAFGHTGFTGTSLWIDPELDLFVVLLTNRVNPTRDNRKHIPLRRAVHDLAATAITDRPVPPRQPAPPPDAGEPGGGP